MSNGDLPAYPVLNNDGLPGMRNALGAHPDLTLGLTKREEFAKAAMQGLLASGAWKEGKTPSEIVWMAYHLADEATEFDEPPP